MCIQQQAQRDPHCVLQEQYDTKPSDVSDSSRHLCAGTVHLERGRTDPGLEVVMSADFL